MANYVDFDFEGMLSITACAKICKKTPQTIYRWQREGWPIAYRQLCELHASGRILPQKWRHARFNTKGNLQLHNGEVNEHEILNIAYMRYLTDELKKISEKKDREILRLRAQVNELSVDSANDFYR